METNNQPPPPTAGSGYPAEVPANNSWAWLVAIMVGGILGVLASIPLTGFIIEDDPSSTAALLYIFTIPLGAVCGAFLGVMFRWRKLKS